MEKAFKKQSKSILMKVEQDQRTLFLHSSFIIIFLFGILGTIVATSLSPTATAQDFDTKLQLVPTLDDPTTIVIPLGQRQLFLDDEDIAEVVQLQRTMHKPDKKGAVIRPDVSQGIRAVQIRMAPIWNPEKQVWQIWDTAGEPNELHAAGYLFSGYYESKDGLHWSKTHVGDLEYHGSSDNNYVSVIMGGRRHRAECIVRDETDPDPNRRYKTLTPNVFRSGNGGYAVSPDGLHWTEISSPGIYAGDEWNLTFDSQEHLFMQYLKRGGKYGRAIWLSTSHDFATWTEPELIFEADDLDQKRGIQRIQARLSDPTFQPLIANNPEVYNIDVYHMNPFRYESRYLAMPAMYHAVGRVPAINNTDGFHVVELVSSRDLKHWTRQGDRHGFIEPSRIGTGAYDLTQIIGPTSAVVHGDELWLYYTGTKTRGAGSLPDGQRPRMESDNAAICLAVLRRDGFVSLEAGMYTALGGPDSGAILTRPFPVPGGKLLVNLEAPQGELLTEVLDKNGQVLARSVLLQGDHPQSEVEWEKGEMEKLTGKVVSLRFTLRDGHFYSYWFE